MSPRSHLSFQLECVVSTCRRCSSRAFNRFEDGDLRATWRDEMGMNCRKRNAPSRFLSLRLPRVPPHLFYAILSPLSSRVNARLSFSEDHRINRLGLRCSVGLHSRDRLGGVGVVSTSVHVKDAEPGGEGPPAHEQVEESPIEGSVFCLRVLYWRSRSAAALTGR